MDAMTRAQLMEELLVEQFASYGHSEWVQPAPRPVGIPVDDHHSDGPDAEVIELRPRRIA